MPSRLLLDSSVVIAAGLRETRRDVDIDLKVAALSCDRFAVMKSTLVELQTWLIHQSPKFASPVVQLFRQLSDRGLLDTIDDESELASVMPSDLDAVASSIREQLAFQGRKGPAQLFHDVRLILLAQHLALPVLTLDNAVRRALPQQAFSASMRFPVHLPSIQEISLYDAFSLSGPLRAIYVETFSIVLEQAAEVNRLLATREATERQLRDLRAEFARAESRLTKSEELVEAWRAAASPSVFEAGAWTLIETILSLAGVPIPTTPITHIISVLRMRRLRDASREFEEPGA